MPSDSRLTPMNFVLPKSQYLIEDTQAPSRYAPRNCLNISSGITQGIYKMYRLRLLRNILEAPTSALPRGGITEHRSIKLPGVTTTVGLAANILPAAHAALTIYDVIPYTPAPLEHPMAAYIPITASWPPPYCRPGTKRAARCHSNLLSVPICSTLPVWAILL